MDSIVTEDSEEAVICLYFCEDHKQISSFFFLFLYKSTLRLIIQFMHLGKRINKD